MGKKVYKNVIEQKYELVKNCYGTGTELIILKPNSLQKYLFVNGTSQS